MNHIKDRLFEEGNCKINVFRWEKSTCSKIIIIPWKEGAVGLEVDKLLTQPHFYH